MLSILEKSLDYIGDELTLFSHATNWKGYWGNKIVPYLGSDVLEVGAGIGTNTQHLISSNSVENWVCLEPDPELAKRIKPTIAYQETHKYKLEVNSCFLKDYTRKKDFDSILYIDVIEHIENEVDELKLAVDYLKPGGYLIILVPAHNFLFSEFDKAIGHYRRYQKKMLKAAVPNGLTKEKLIYLDSVGMFASMTNKLILQQKYPKIKQIKFWDNTIIPLSKVTDKITFNLVGKTLLGVWKKP
ncbi:MAG: methyltransferase type 12 [Bacteroidetes bacterium]|nr:MAG: methyltransferase type 12 [Bacteroidota bacterium]